MSDHTSRAAGRTAKGFSTRAIAAASRAPQVDQVPTSVPIYRTLLRVSVGLEDLEDLQADFSAALEAARRVAPASAVV